jgi:hypothetical protein
MSNYTTVWLPEEQRPLLREALKHYRFESAAGFFRVCAYLLIEHYQRGEELSLPLKILCKQKPKE